MTAIDLPVRCEDVDEVTVCDRRQANLLNLLIASWDRLTNEGLAARSIIRARARALTQRPYTEPQSIPLLIIYKPGSERRQQ